MLTHSSTHTHTHTHTYIHTHEHTDSQTHLFLLSLRLHVVDQPPGSGRMNGGLWTVRVVVLGNHQDFVARLDDHAVGRVQEYGFLLSEGERYMVEAGEKREEEKIDEKGG